jgi:S1-C subfamily serine protease
LLIAGGIGAAIDLRPTAQPASSAAPASPTAPLGTVRQPSSATTRTDQGASVAAIAARVDPAVVDINTTVASVTGGPGARAAGTGMLITPTGEVLTNNHVIQSATRISVTIAGRGSYPAKVIGASPTSDVALLQLQSQGHASSGLPTVSLADSSSLSVGQDVVAIGNALGRGGTPTATAGQITGLDRSIVAHSDVGDSERLYDLIQTDAQISPGDSGGPLVNTAGQVVGMITAGSTGFRMSSSTRVGFAIPTDDAVAVVDQIRAGHAGPNVIIGEAGYIGIQASSVDPGTAARLNVPVGSGVLVAGLVPGGPAQQAGIRAGSVITAVNGEQIGSLQELGSLLHTHKPGETVSVTWVDGGGTHTATVRLVSGPAV